MAKKTIISFDKCLDCPYCSESGQNGDSCFNSKSPNGENCTLIPNVYSIPSWCPLEDV